MNILNGWLSITILVAVCSAWIIISSRITGGERVIIIDKKLSTREKKFWSTMIQDYIVWGTIQQIAVIFLYQLLCNIPIDKTFVLWITVLIFIIAHTPNFFLAPWSGLLAVFFIGHYDIYGNILAIGIGHGVLGTIMKFYVPSKLSGSFATWKGYIKKMKEINK